MYYCISSAFPFFISFSICVSCFLVSFTDIKDPERDNIYSKILNYPDITARLLIQRQIAKDKKEAIKIFTEMEKLDLGKMIKSPRGAISFERNK